MTTSLPSKAELRHALAESADDPDRLARLLADDSITDLDLRHALRSRLPSSVAVFVMERSRFGTRQTVLGAVARSPTTTPRLALQASQAFHQAGDPALLAERGDARLLQRR